MEGIGIASAVPHLNDIFFDACRAYFKIDPFFITGQTDLPFHLSHYCIGADRLAGLVAALRQFPEKMCHLVFDFGTATTFSVIYEKTFIGGGIIPGIETSAACLNRRIPHLPLAEGFVIQKKPEKILCHHTEDAIISGIFFSQKALVQEVLQHIFQQISVTHEETVSIGTGGLSFLFKDCNLFTTISPFLVVEGIFDIFFRKKSTINH